MDAVFGWAANLWHTVTNVSVIQGVEDFISTVVIVAIVGAVFLWWGSVMIKPSKPTYEDHVEHKYCCNCKHNLGNECLKSNQKIEDPYNSVCSWFERG